MDPEWLTAGQRDLAASYRSRRLRSMSTGDVARLGPIALACDSVGFREVPAELNVVQVSEHGTVPLDDDGPAEAGP